MSVFEEIENIPKQVLGSDLEDKIQAKLLSITKTSKKGQYAGTPLIKIELQLPDNTTFSTTYRIPKALTGKSQLELLQVHFKQLGLTPKEAIGKTFQWQRKELPGSVKGNPRHYPVKLVK